MADSSIIARLALKARDFTTEFASTLSRAERQAQSSGKVIARGLGEGIGDGLRDLQTRIPLVGSALTGLSGPAAVATAAFAGVALAVGHGVAELDEFERAARGLDASLAATGNRAGYTRDQLVAMAEDMEGRFAIPAEEILAVQRALLTFEGVAGSSLERTIEAAADLSEVFGGDLAGNATKLATVLQNLATGSVDGLRRGFKELGDAELSQVEALAEAGKGYEAQVALLKALERYKGAAAAAAETLGSKYFLLNDALGESTKKMSSSTGAYEGAKTLTDSLTKRVELLGKSYEEAGSKAESFKILAREAAQFILSPIGYAAGAFDDPLPSEKPRPTPLRPGATNDNLPTFEGGKFVPTDADAAARAEAERARQAAIAKAYKEQTEELDKQRGLLERRLQLGEDQAKVEEAVEAALAKAKGASAEQRAEIERSVRANATLEQQAQSRAKAEGAAARAAAQAADAQVRRNKELEKAIKRVEQEADLLGTTKEAQADILELMQLQETAGRALTDMERERLAYARAIVRVTEAGLAALEDLQNFDPTSVQDVTSDKAIDKPLTDAIEKNLEDFDKQLERIDAEHTRRWEEAGRAGGRALRDEGLLAVEAVGLALGGKLGRTVTKIAAIFNGLGTGDFTGLGNRAGGLLTVLGGGKLAQQGEAQQGGQLGGTITAGFEGLGQKLDGLLGTGPSLSDLRQSGYGSDAIPKGMFEQFGKVAGQGLQGAALGDLANDFTDPIIKELGLKTSKLGGQIGGALGQFVGGPLGAAIGGALGSAVGGLFKSTKKASTTIDFDGGDLTAGGIRGNTGKYDDALNGIAESFIGTLGELADRLGGQIAGDPGLSFGVRHGDFRVDPTGQGLTKKKRGAVDFDDDAEAALEFAIKTALERGVVSGIRESTKRILTAGGDFQKALEDATAFENVFRELDQLKDPTGAALKELNRQFEELDRVFDEAGASAEERAQLEELYGLKRKAILEQTLEDMSDQLIDFRDGLKAGSNSPLSLKDQRANIEEQLAKFETDITAGKTVDQGAFIEAAQTLLDIERQLNGSTAGFFEQFNRIQSLTDKAIANGGASNVTSIGTDIPSPFGQPATTDVGKDIASALGGPTTATARSTAETVHELRQGFALLGQKLDALAAGGSDFIGGDRRRFVDKTFAA